MVTTGPADDHALLVGHQQADEEDHDAGADHEDGPADVLDADAGHLPGEQDRADDHEDEADRQRRSAAFRWPLGCVGRFCHAPILPSAATRAAASMSARWTSTPTLGRASARWTLGDDERLVAHISSANVACGFHAGDFRVMEATVAMCRRAGVAVGAQPGYPDLLNFGRRPLAFDPDEVESLVRYQIGALDAFCRAHGVEMQHVKPHGALYNQAAADPSLSAAIARATAKFSRDVALYGLASSEPMAAAAADVGLRFVPEAFADRRYLADGTLQPRSEPASLITDPADAAAQAVSIAVDGKVLAADGSSVALRAESICCHGDTPGAVDDRRRGSTCAGGRGRDGGRPRRSVIRPFGEAALLVELRSSDLAQALAASLRARTDRRAWSRRCRASIPAGGARSAAWRSGTRLGQIEPHLAGLRPLRQGGRLHTIPVTYDGPDLDTVAELTGLTAAEVVAPTRRPSCACCSAGSRPASPTSATCRPSCGSVGSPHPRTRTPSGLRRHRGSDDRHLSRGSARRLARHRPDRGHAVRPLR